MTLRNITKKPKKPKVSNTRRHISIEELKIGQETTDWSSVPQSEYEHKIYETLRHYNYFNDSKETFKWACDWIKQNMSRQALNEFKASSDRMFSITAGGLCKIMLNGGKISVKAKQLVDNEIAMARQRGLQALTAEKPEVPQRTIADIIKDNTSNFIAEVEVMLDDFYRGIHIDIENYSVYNELKKIDAPASIAKALIEYYTPLKAEIEELLTKKTPDLVEGYNHLSLKQKRDYLALLNVIISDSEKYLDSKKALRKTRIKKPKSIDQQVAKVKYLKDSAEYKLTSINPSNIIGCDQLYMFNTKTRQLIYLSTTDAGGFKINGTTVQNIDEKTSVRKTLRKPDEFLSEFMKASKTKAYGLYSKLTTKPAAANGRINDCMILLKAFK